MIYKTYNKRTYRFKGFIPDYLTRDVTDVTVINRSDDLAILYVPSSCFDANFMKLLVLKLWINSVKKQLLTKFRLQTATKSCKLLRLVVDSQLIVCKKLSVGRSCTYCTSSFTVSRTTSRPHPARRSRHHLSPGTPRNTKLRQLAVWHYATTAYETLCTFYYTTKRFWSFLIW